MAILEEKKSLVNDTVQVYRELGLGTYIKVKGLTQSGGIVNSIWRQTLKRVKKQVIKADSCLVLGLGGGGVVAEIKKEWPDADIVGIDIDPVMVELGKKYLGLKKFNPKIIISDAYDFVRKVNTSKEKYDLILVDLYLGTEYPKKFENEAFLNFLKNSLAPKGAVVINRLYGGERRKEAIKFGEKLENIFGSVGWYYPYANIMFICGEVT